jgi:Fe-S-cluster-containing dehydrogenase component
MSPRWGMVVDLDRCTGCEACVVACRLENNVPVVGAEQVDRDRGIYWIRIERYWEGEYPNVRARFAPVLCQHCQRAPCEPVCPVYASYHGTDGLNEQVYNRCVGTRYCANNCPYSVRFFNWFDYDRPETLRNQLNPDVTVRMRGIMEKCTFCIQRIRRARLAAMPPGTREPTEEELLSVRLEDGAVQPACVQTCPTGALVFGDLSDPNSQVYQLAQRAGRSFRLLEELGTEPVVIYLKEL